VGAANNNFDLVSNPVGDETIEAEGSWHTVNQGQHVGAEVLLKRGQLIEVV
jgi:hypothetical protein